MVVEYAMDEKGDPDIDIGTGMFVKFCRLYKDRFGTGTDRVAIGQRGKNHITV